MAPDKMQALAEAAKACPHQTWAAFTDDSDSNPHTNLVSFKDRTECVLSLPGLHKNDPLVAYLWAAQPRDVLGVLAEREELLGTIRLVKRMIDEALPKFNWGASMLDANAIGLLNDASIAVDRAVRNTAVAEAL